MREVYKIRDRILFKPVLLSRVRDWAR